ncbi:MAG: helicase HerA-like domain-containing protein, partial [Pseudomonadota bacterium]|nr:helicase HerA-like domain-containing protein [Pseudomonadota bacterium]
LSGKYEDRIDRDSAYEMLKRRADAAAQEAEAAEAEEEAAEPMVREFRAARRFSGSRVGRSSSRSLRSNRRGDTVTEALGKALVKELSGTTGRRLVRGVLGGLFKGR